LELHPDTVADRLDKMPYANVPPAITDITADFASSMKTTAVLVAGVDRDLKVLRQFVEQSRLNETPALVKDILNKLNAADDELRQAEYTVDQTGEAFGVSLTGPFNTLRGAYEEVLAKINRIRGLLQFYRNMLAEFSAVNTRISTFLTLEIEPESQFVGEDVKLSGILTSSDGPMGGREITFLIGGSLTGAVKTSDTGRYEMAFQVPYRYIPDVRVQAVYFPRGEDVGVYLSALSEEKILHPYYNGTAIEITLPAKAYPGLETTIAGFFVYGKNVEDIPREIDIYFDNVFIGAVTASRDFSFTLTLRPDIATGKHSVTVSTPAAGRYAPGVGGAILEVTQAVPVLNLELPRVAFIPGALTLNGMLTSEIGPVPQALITFRSGKDGISTRSLDDGSFNASLRTGMVISFIGAEVLEITVTPQTVWHDGLMVSRKILFVNYVTSSLFLVLLTVLVFVSRRIKVRIPAYLKRQPRPVRKPPEVGPEPVYTTTAVIPAELVDAAEEIAEPRGRIIGFYIALLKLAQKVARFVVRPNQTLRELARDLQKSLGPVGEYFMELTRLVEKLLYSSHTASDEDIQKSEQISRRIRGELKE
ncbi:MAG: DUF4129 domain-containing protein, partial [Dehalococcoidia bacterium]|nr:DUF4129 domain-containing protein [Dehalococcoidia bacterium]